MNSHITELNDYCEEKGAIGGTMRLEAERDFYKQKYEEYYSIQTHTTLGFFNGPAGKLYEEVKKELEETKASEQLASHVATVNAEDIVELRKENVGLKSQNEYLKLQLKKQDIIHAQNRAEVSEEKKYSTEQRERGDKYMEELKQKTKKVDELKKELSEELLEGVKLHNTNHLYKGFVCSHVIEKLKGDIECVGDGQVDINFGEWLGLFYGEKFYEEIIPVIIKEITEHKEVGSSYEDGYWYYSWADKYELEHNKGGCISYTRIEDTSDEE